MILSRVQVLLSTYNGALYLRQQIESILQQDYPDVEILIRDDGSTDQTVNLIKEYMSDHSNIKLLEGTNLGVVRSFFHLLLKADLSADYYAFCDQDDIWRPHKISYAVHRMKQSNIPQLFASRAEFIDADGQSLGYSGEPKLPLGLRHALVQNRLIGCTMLFNQHALQLIRTCAPNLSLVHVHDWWLYLVVGTFGEVIFDNEPTVLYRQHQSNVIGNKNGSLRARLRRFAANQRRCTMQANAFRACYYVLLDNSQRQIIDRFLDGRSSLAKRIGYAFSGEVYRQELLNNLILKLLIILNRV